MRKTANYPVEDFKEDIHFYQQIAETTQEGIIVINDKGLIQFMNKAIEPIFGYSEKELIGQHLTLLIPEKSRSKHTKVLSTHTRTSIKTFPCNINEKEGLHKKGHILPLEISFDEYHRNGKLFFTGIVRDIGERTKAEKESKTATQVLENISIGITDSIIILNNNYEITWANKAMLEEVGLEKLEDIIGKKCYNTTHHLDSPCELEICPISDIIRTRKPKKIKHVHLDNNNNEIYVEVTAYPIINDEGEILEHVHITKNITEKKIIEEALQISEEKYRTLIEAAADAIFLADYETGELVEANSSASELLGLPISEIIGMKLYEIHPPQEAVKYKELFKKYKVNGKIIAFEEEHTYIQHKSKKKNTRRNKNKPSYT